MSTKMGTVTAEVRADNSQFKAVMKETVEVAKSAGQATESATTRAADTINRKNREIAELAKKYAQETVDEQLIALERLRAEEKRLAADQAKFRRAAEKGWDGEIDGMQKAAAVAQRLAQVKREIAAISIQTSVPQVFVRQANERVATAASAAPTAGIDPASQAVAAATIAETQAKAELKAVTDALAASTLDEETKQKALAAANNVASEATRARIEAEQVLKDRIASGTAELEKQRRAAEANATLQDKLSSGQASPIDQATQTVAAATIAETQAKAELKNVTDALATSTLDEESKQKALAAAQIAVNDATRVRQDAEQVLKDRTVQSTAALEQQSKAAEANAAIQQRLATTQASPAGQHVAAAVLENAAAQKALREAQDLVSASTVSEEEKQALLAPVLERARIATIELAEANDKLASTSHKVVTGQQATSGAIRSLEGNAGLRAVENFIAKTLGLGPIMQAIFPIVGALAFGQILYDIGEKAVAMEQKAVHAGEAIKSAFQDLHEKAQVTIDDLAIQNDKLQDEIDKLSGHPNNGLQTALDEARKMADQLLESLQADRKELKALLKENDVSNLGSVLTGVARTAQTASTSKQAEELVADQKKLTEAMRKADREFAATVAKSNDPEVIKAATEKKNAAVRVAFQTQIDAYNHEAQRLRNEQSESERDATLAQMAGPQGGGLHAQRIDNSAKVANVEGRSQQLQDALARETQIEQIATKQQKADTLKQGKELAGATNKAGEERLKAMEAELNQEKLEYNLSIKAEFDYWEERKKAFRAGSNEYNTILAKQATLAVEASRRVHKLIRKSQDEQKGDDARRQKAMEEGAKGTSEMTRDNARTRQDKYDTSNELHAISQRSDAELESIRIREQAALEENRIHYETGKSLTQEAAAMALAAVHTREYAQQLANLENSQDAEIKRLQDKKAALEANPLLSNGPEDQQKKIDALERQIAELQAQNRGRISQMHSAREIQIQQDTYAIKNADQSAVKGATDALIDFRNAAMDTAAQMRKLVSDLMDGIHQQLLNAVTGQRTDFRGVGKTVATDVADMGLKKLETTGLNAAEPLLKKLGLGGMFGGKKDGQTSSTAMWVQMANASTPPIVPHLPGMGNDPGNGMADSSGMGSVASTALGMFGIGTGKADGQSEGTALWVRQPGQSGSTSGVSSLLSGLGGGDSSGDSGSGDGGGSAFSDVLSTALGMLPGFASGGPIPRNQLSIVGEHGPELFVPGTSGTIIPNHELMSSDPKSLTSKTGPTASRTAAMVAMRSAQSMVRAQKLPKYEMGGPIGANTMAMVGERGPELFMPESGGRIVPNQDLNGIFGDKHEWHIDARGATDPAQVHAQIMAAAPHIAAAAVRAVGEKRMRTPSSRH